MACLLTCAVVYSASCLEAGLVSAEPGLRIFRKGQCHQGFGFDIPDVRYYLCLL